MADGEWAGVPVLVVALGGNAITRTGDEPSVQAQFRRTRATVEHLVPLVAEHRWRVVLTHGNGPQVGNILLRSDIAAQAGELPSLPIDSAVADTQGAMGYMIQQCLSNALCEAGLRVPVVTVVTQVLVDDRDPAFEEPSKPIGRFYGDDELEPLRRRGWALRRDGQGRGWRRVVPSPQPYEIVEQDIVCQLLAAGAVVIACGGGGIPVVRTSDGALAGVEAVVDKDRASALLARQVGADTFAILTDVEHVEVDHGTPTAAPIESVDVPTLRSLLEAGQFAPGSMAPKVEAMLDFVSGGGRRAVVTDDVHLRDALEGRAGTALEAAHPARAAGGR